MNEGRRPAADESDGDEPIEALADFETEAPAGLRSRVRHAIQRRLLSSDVAEFAWATPFLIVFAFMDAVFGLFAGTSKTEEDER